MSWVGEYVRDIHVFDDMSHPDARCQCGTVTVQEDQEALRRRVSREQLVRIDRKRYLTVDDDTEEAFLQRMVSEGRLMLINGHRYIKVDVER